MKSQWFDLGFSGLAFFFPLRHRPHLLRCYVGNSRLSVAPLIDPIWIIWRLICVRIECAAIWFSLSDSNFKRIRTQVWTWPSYPKIKTKWFLFVCALEHLDHLYIKWEIFAWDHIDMWIEWLKAWTSVQFLVVCWPPSTEQNVRSTPKQPTTIFG